MHVVSICISKQKNKSEENSLNFVFYFSFAQKFQRGSRKKEDKSPQKHIHIRKWQLGDNNKIQSTFSVLSLSYSVCLLIAKVRKRAQKTLL
jgi:hypothetical protein